MTTKEIAIQKIRELPDSATWEDIEERVRFVAAVEKGSEQIKEGRTIPHDQVKKNLESWLSR